MLLTFRTDTLLHTTTHAVIIIHSLFHTINCIRVENSSPSRSYLHQNHRKSRQYLPRFFGTCRLYYFQNNHLYTQQLTDVFQQRFLRDYCYHSLYLFLL